VTELVEQAYLEYPVLKAGVVLTDISETKVITGVDSKAGFSKKA
jgi:hypothetical protein